MAIDPHAGNDRGPEEIAGFADEAAADRDAFRANLERAGVADRVRHVAAFSTDAHGEVEDPIDVLYIDGAHRYGPARNDVHEWGARVMDGGTLLIHDAFSSIGVTGAIGRAPRLRRPVPLRRAIALARRVPRRPARQRGRAGCATPPRQLAQLGWFARNVGLKVILKLGYGRLAARLGRPVPEWPY